MNRPQTLNYVLGVAIDDQTDEIVTLLKDRGPEYLIGKHNFPGGKSVTNEPMAHAMEREYREECGLTIPSNRWYLFDVSHQHGYSIYSYLTIYHNLHEARTMESEVVSIRSIGSVMTDMKNNPDMYPEGFKKRLTKALAYIPNAKAFLGPSGLRIF